MPRSTPLPDHLARRRAVALAGHRGDEAAARAGLSDVNPGVRATAVGALARIGALTGDELRAAAQDASAVVRIRAAEVAPRAMVAADAHALLLGLLTDGDGDVVEMAAWACGEVDGVDPTIIARLAGIATDHRDALVREAAVAALGAIGDEAGLPAILAATRDKPAVRRRAVLALAPFEGRDVDEALTRATADRDWQVRQAAEDLLAE
jgi:HEAT repeat protein